MINLLRVLREYLISDLLVPMINAFVNFIQWHTLGWTRLQICEPPSGLLALPVELLTEVLKLLSWKDVLHIREVLVHGTGHYACITLSTNIFTLEKTCRILSDATRTRAIWVNLVKEHISSKPIPPSLERPIEVQSSSELEDLFLLWMGAEIGWRKDDGHPSRERTFVCEPAEIAHLVKGGRWYLATSATAAVTYYDLNAEVISGATLIPHQIKERLDNDIVVATDDTDHAQLKFNMVFSLLDRTPSTETSATYHTIHVWSVTSMSDDSGYVIGLTATRIATFPHRPTVFKIFSLSIRGPDIAFIAFDRGSHNVYILVVEWGRANGDSLYPMRTIAKTYNNTSVFLLSRNRLLHQSPSGLRLYGYVDVPETTSFQSNVQDTDFALWTLPFPNNLVTKILTHISVPHTTNVVVSNGKTLLALAIEDQPSSDETPRLFPLHPLPADYRVSLRISLGLSHGVIVSVPLKSCELITYTCPGGSDSVGSLSSVHKSISSDLPFSYPTPILDEETARIVIPGTSVDPEAYIIDFGLMTSVKSRRILDVA